MTFFKARASFSFITFQFEALVVRFRTEAQCTEVFSWENIYSTLLISTIRYLELSYSGTFSSSAISLSINYSLSRTFFVSNILLGLTEVRDNERQPYHLALKWVVYELGSNIQSKWLRRGDKVFYRILISIVSLWWIKNAMQLMFDYVK